MTSTNGFFGISEEKNSSKVLRPPGGGHTDIFGAPEPPVRRDSGRNASSILEGKTLSTDKKLAVPNEASPSQNEEEKSAPASRSRVPPGGFSSGPFW